MSTEYSSSFWKKVKRFLWRLDAWADDSVYHSCIYAEAFWERITNYSNALRVRGFKRLILDLMAEAFTLSTAGGLVVLMLAKPAFELTSDNWLKTQNLSVTFLDRYGQEIGHRGALHNDTLKLEDYPDHLIKAALATEDRRFYEHWGVDPVGIMRALSVNAKAGGVKQGGSTLSQQLAKNLFLTNEQTIDRKIKEAFLAFWLEAHLSKEEILKLYLDRAYMGAGVHGVTAAAEYYFDKSVKDLSLAESAMLAGLFKAPSRYAPHANLPAARARAADVLNNMVEAGFTSRSHVQYALKHPATPVNRLANTTPDFYLDWAFNTIKALDSQGKFGSERILLVKTPFDPSIQAVSDKVLDNTVRQSGKTFRFKQGAVVVMDVDGAVRSITGGRDYGQSQFNRATDALRQPGSSFKPVVYAAALTANSRLRPTSTVVDSQICIGRWCPKNYGRSFAGAVPLWLAVAKSINTIPVRLTRDIGKGDSKKGRLLVHDMARKLGIARKLTDSTSLPIGAAEVTVLDMAAVYSVFGNGGFQAEPYAALEVYDGQGKTIYEHKKSFKPKRVLKERVVADMNLMLSRVVSSGTGRRATIQGLPQAGKTGTTNAYRDAWYVGYSGNMSAAVWLGNDNNKPMGRMTGGVIPAQIWREIMLYAHQGLDLKPIPYLADKPKTIPTVPQKMQNQGVISKQSYEAIGQISDLLQTSKNTTTHINSVVSLN